jgi:hypothetical protein
MKEEQISLSLTGIAKKDKAKTTPRIISCVPEVHKKRNGDKVVFLPGFDGVAFIKSEEFILLVGKAKLGTFDAIVNELLCKE